MPKKRKLSAYNRHIQREMKKGKTMKQAAASWKRGPRRRTVRGVVAGKARKAARRVARKIKRRSRNTTFNMQKIYRLVRVSALALPAAVSLMSATTPEEKFKQIIHKYTGVNPNDGTFRFSKLREGWEPFFWANIATYGIPKIVSFIKGMLK